MTTPKNDNNADNADNNDNDGEKKRRMPGFQLDAAWLNSRSSHKLPNSCQG